MIRLSRLTTALWALASVACAQGNLDIVDLKATAPSPYAPANAEILGRVAQARGSSTPVKVLVDFGDQQSAEASVGSDGHFSVPHVYQSAGTFNVVVKAMPDNAGPLPAPPAMGPQATTEGTATVSLAVGQPVGGLTVTCLACTEGGACTTQACGSQSGVIMTFRADATGGIGSLHYRWNFGDGETADGQVVTHEFPDEGQYVVTVTATDSISSAISTTVQVELDGLLPVDVYIESNTTTGSAPFTANVTLGVSGEGPLRLFVNWGDSSTSSFENLSSGDQLDEEHTFTVPGQYTVTANAVDRLNRTQSTTLVFNVNN
ncbi:MAG: PKD domain-containing protein [Myxococcota bacterium]